MMLLSLLPVTALASNTTTCSGGDSCKHEAAIGNTHYDTIGEAIDAANKASGSGTTTIKLLRDAALTGGEQSGYYKIKYISKNITLDLGTHTLTCNENGGFAVNPNCHFTIQNGTYINTSKDPYAQAIEGTKFNGGPGCTMATLRSMFMVRLSAARTVSLAPALRIMLPWMEHISKLEFMASISRTKTADRPIRSRTALLPRPKQAKPALFSFPITKKAPRTKSRAGRR